MGTAGKIILSDGDFGTYEIIDKDTDISILIQVDWDYPGVASTFGWSPKKKKGCSHRSTDGTVDCPTCGKTAREFIYEAQQWLDNHIGVEVEDPGYFS